MSSIEALAMAGVECGISLEERERGDVEKIPLYLLAGQGEEEDRRSHEEEDKLMREQWQLFPDTKFQRQIFHDHLELIAAITVKASTIAQSSSLGTMDHGH
ncbi:hypothetical protein SADUNF_Sadunf07G0082400 [Salix dunnii]|uniref:Uncharacterized protein n=1 Tax=Salix dunnii TaxID=1413687 RepID=A0A835K142_9ROSI|nr:hypothetical protein SADUNF_Sadunf07G0082400 [Salix dunnii]